MRNVLSIVPRASQDMVAAVIRTIFAQPDAKHIQTQFDEVTRMLERTRPEVAAMLHDARDSKGGDSVPELIAA
jgi:transposase-like protein